jgi:hypothetical protein
VTIYCIDEPNVNRKTKYKSYSSTSATPYKLRYPDGRGSHSSTVRLNTSNRRGIRGVISCTSCHKSG